MKTETAAPVANTVEKAAKRARPEPRAYTLVQGKCGRQGDLYFWPVPMNHKHGEKIESKGEPVQLVNGSTRGSRHCAALPEGWQAFKADGTFASDRQIQNVLLVPPPEGGSLEITHPEHAHHHVKVPAGCAVLVTSQRDYAQDALARVRD
jgi:hypothetical protein